MRVFFPADHNITSQLHAQNIFAGQAYRVKPKTRRKSWNKRRVAWVQQTASSSVQFAHVTSCGTSNGALADAGFLRDLTN
ncbi:hypothetical protein MTR72_24420 [Bradyrhizobium sp. ISRA442]|uniref:hypothetical protein n=1 Tax=Bradyrhizobium sp. ISRA442 TaxID=2866197 RepID=UPI00311AEC32